MLLIYSSGHSKKKQTNKQKQKKTIFNSTQNLLQMEMLILIEI